MHTVPHLTTINLLFTIILLTLQDHVESLSTRHNFARTIESNRVFVAGISKTCTKKQIQSTFSKFGSIQDITIIGQEDGEKSSSNKRKRSPYCFISFQDVPSAQRALAASKPIPDCSIYKEVRHAMPLDSRRRSNKSRRKEIQEELDVKRFQDANLIVQVQSTHLDRLDEYLNRLRIQVIDQHDILEDKTEEGVKCFELLGSTCANTKNMSLLFLSTQGDPIALSRIICMDPVLARAVNKSYIVQPGIFKGSLSTVEGNRDFAQTIVEKIAAREDISVDEGQRILRVQVFPPKYQYRFLQAFDDILIKDEEISKKLAIAPSGFNYMLSVVQVYQYKGKGQEHRQSENNELYMAGISTASYELDVVDTNKHAVIDGGVGDVNRAYYKLKEAFQVYGADHGIDKKLKGSVALDCGSAPGGWTKYLIEHLQCKKVHSIDPGFLSSSVLNLKETNHMQMLIEDAIPILLENGALGGIQIWVSDMCLHRMEEQLDLLLLAKEQGLLAPNAFFVLTLKCVVGRSKASFDYQVQRVVDKLCKHTNVEKVSNYHLFSNRSGERTIMGYMH